MVRPILVRREVVTQVDLENYLTYNTQIERLTKLRDEIGNSAIRKLTTGGELEDGRRSYDIEERYEAGVRMQKLIVR